MQTRRFGVALVVIVLALFATACGDDSKNKEKTKDTGPAKEKDGNRIAERLFPTDEHSGPKYDNCIFTSPYWYESGGESWVLLSRSAGVIAAVDPTTGKEAWSVELPNPKDEGAKFLLSTPAKVGEHLVVAYHIIGEDFGDFRAPGDTRLAHLVAVVDLEDRKVDEEFPVVELQAEVEANEPNETVKFKPKRALTRPTVVHGKQPDDELGRVYISQGNTRDLQPWHGWAWEVDLDAWKEQGADAALSGVLNTTPEPDSHCGEPGTSGSRERKCGGGLWAPNGNLVVDKPDGGYEIILAPGNGQLDIPKRDYANTLMKLQPGLEFDPKCDMSACADFNPDKPSDACIESCQNLFVPRRLPGQEIPKPTDGRCEDRDTMFECWQVMDYIGGSVPVRVEVGDKAVLIYPTKDGYAYMADADHLGTMYDRHRLVQQCGDNGGSCSVLWAGMSVTKPTETTIDGGPAVLIPTFMPDETNPAGVVALKVVLNDQGKPTLERAWEYPDFDSEEAVKRFRLHPSRVALGDDEELAWIVDKGKGGGKLFGIRVEDGSKAFEIDMATRGRRFITPLIRDDRIYVSSCHDNKGPGKLEAFQIKEQSKSEQ